MTRRIWAFAAAALAWAGGSHGANAATTWTVDCSSATNSTISNGVTIVANGLTPSNALGSLLGTPLGPGSVTPAPQPNDTILINSLCTEDVTIRTSGLTLANPTGASGTLITGDGVGGQLEVAGAANTVIDGLSIGPTSIAGGESADLYVHDGSALNLMQSQVVNSPIIGIEVARSSSVSLTDTSVTSNGLSSSTPSQTGMGILVENNSTLTLGTDSGTEPAMVTSNTGSGVVVDDASSVVINAATISGNQLTQVTVLGASSGFMTGLTTSPGTVAPTTTITSPTRGTSQAIFASGASTLDIEQGVVVMGSQSVAAISLEGSSLLLNGSLISSGAGSPSPATAQPTITASANSVIALAGGNSICFGTLSVATPPECTVVDGGSVIQLNHVATLVQVGGSVLGYPLEPDNLTGGAGAQLQSTMDLGLGFIGSSTPTLNWVTGSKEINLSQNSSFRLQGGVNITGSVQLSQASNGFFNLANNAPGNTNPNTITPTPPKLAVSCSFTSIPASHILVAPNALSPTVNPATSMSPTPANGVCLAF